MGRGRKLLNARFEIRRNGRRNSARFTREAANRLARTMRARGDTVKVIEGRRS